MIHLHKDPTAREVLVSGTLKYMLNVVCEEEYKKPYSEMSGEQQLDVLYTNWQHTTNQLLQRDSYIGESLGLEIDEIHGFFHDLDNGKEQV